jgi:hypothetical protein
MEDFSSLFAVEDEAPKAAFALLPPRFDPQECQHVTMQLCEHCIQQFAQGCLGFSGFAMKGTECMGVGCIRSLSGFKRCERHHVTMVHPAPSHSRSGPEPTIVLIHLLRRDATPQSLGARSEAGGGERGMIICLRALLSFESKLLDYLTPVETHF